MCREGVKAVCICDLHMMQLWFIILQNNVLTAERRHKMGSYKSRSSRPGNAHVLQLLQGMRCRNGLKANCTAQKERCCIIPGNLAIVFRYKIYDDWGGLITVQNKPVQLVSPSPDYLQLDLHVLMRTIFIHPTSSEMTFRTVGISQPNHRLTEFYVVIILIWSQHFKEVFRD